MYKYSRKRSLHEAAILCTIDPECNRLAKDDSTGSWLAPAPDEMCYIKAFPFTPKEERVSVYAMDDKHEEVEGLYAYQLQYYDR